MRTVSTKGLTAYALAHNLLLLLRLQQNHSGPHSPARPGQHPPALLSTPAPPFPAPGLVCAFRKRGHLLVSCSHSWISVASTTRMGLTFRAQLGHSSSLSQAQSLRSLPLNKREKREQPQSSFLGQCTLLLCWSRAPARFVFFNGGS